METNTDTLKENKSELPGLKTGNLQQRLLTEFTNNKSTDIVDIEEAEKVITREENY